MHIICFSGVDFRISDRLGWHYRSACVIFVGSFGYFIPA